MNKEILDTILSSLAEVLGEYATKTIIGGGVALLIYRNYFTENDNQNLPNPAATKDIDVLIPRIIKSGSITLGERLVTSGFKRQEHSLEIPPVESYVGEINGEEINVEFLTHRRTRTKSNSNINVSGVSAQPLSYLEMSLSSSKKFTTTNNKILQVVSPGAWIFHKALTFPKRKISSKQAKDLYGIWFLGSQLSTLSTETLNELKILTEENAPGWKKTAKNNLANWVLSASQNDWKTLEKQDPEGVLVAQSFRRFINEDMPL